MNKPSKTPFKSMAKRLDDLMQVKVEDQFENMKADDFRSVEEAEELLALVKDINYIREKLGSKITQVLSTMCEIIGRRDLMGKLAINIDTNTLFMSSKDASCVILLQERYSRDPACKGSAKEWAPIAEAFADSFDIPLRWLDLQENKLRSAIRNRLVEEFDTRLGNGEKLTKSLKHVATLNHIELS